MHLKKSDLGFFREGKVLKKIVKSFLDLFYWFAITLWIKSNIWCFWHTQKIYASQSGMSKHSLFLLFPHIPDRVILLREAPFFVTQGDWCHYCSQNWPDCGRPEATLQLKMDPLPWQRQWMDRILYDALPLSSQNGIKFFRHFFAKMCQNWRFGLFLKSYDNIFFAGAPSCVLFAGFFNQKLK